MASLYKRARSPFHWISFVNPATGVRTQKSTHLRHASPHETRQARELCREVSREDSFASDVPEAWEAWVGRFLEQRYDNQAQSHTRYCAAWHNLAVYLHEHRIEIPRQLTRTHVRDYVGWRRLPHDGVRAGCKNTALFELRTLGLLMREAVQSGFATVNPCERLGISSDAIRRKPRITADEHSAILVALKHAPEWMRVSYLIAWHQGCRFSETRIHLATQLDIARGIIRFRTKGHKLTLTEFPLAPQLVPLFARMEAAGQAWSFEPPPNATMPFRRFFDSLGFTHLSFHCIRVSFITRVLEAGLSREEAMRLVGHSDYVSHQVYARLSADHSTVLAMRAKLDAAC